MAEGFIFHIIPQLRPSLGHNSYAWLFLFLNYICYNAVIDCSLMECRAAAMAWMSLS